MALSDVEDILATFPEFSDAPDGQDVLLERLDDSTASADELGCTESERDWALAYRAAHEMHCLGMGTAAGSPAPSGPVSSERIGSFSVSYAVPSPGGQIDDFSTTPYGRLYLTFLNSHIIGPRTSYSGI